MKVAGGIIFITALLIFVYFFVNNGKSCGGFSANLPNFRCVVGFECVPDSTFPDSNGKCKLNIFFAGVELKNKIKSSTQTTGSPMQNACGGWDTSGEILCQCTGIITKSACPNNTTCDSGTYYCSGECGICCYKGIARNDKYTKCH